MSLLTATPPSAVKTCGLFRIISIPLRAGGQPLQALVTQNAFEGYTLSMFDPNNVIPTPIHWAEHPISHDQKPLDKGDLIALLLIAGQTQLAQRVQNNYPL